MLLGSCDLCCSQRLERLPHNAEKLRDRKEEKDRHHQDRKLDHLFTTKDRIELMNKSPQYFERLVLVCIDSYDSEKRRILQHFSRSTRFAFLCTAQISNFQQKLREFFLHFFRKFSRKFQNFVIFQQNFDKFCPEFHETLRKFMRKQRKC